MPNFTRMMAGISATALGGLLARLKPGDRAWLARQTVRDRHNASAAALAEFSSNVALTWANAQYDVALNGEQWMLQRLGRFGFSTIFDVGANVGDWAVPAVEANPKATVHAFEIMDATYEKLVARTTRFGPRIIANKFGLFDRDGEIEVFYAPDPGSHVHTSIFERSHEIVESRSYVATKMPVRRGDLYLKSVGLDRIDLLKIDVEGAEWQVLMGFAELLERKGVDVIQFEYGKCTILARHWLQDFYTLLEPRGYVLGKLMPDEVQFKPYAVADENFIGPNYVACRRERADIIEAIGWSK